MLSAYRTLLIIAALLFAGCAPSQAQSRSKLDGEHVATITRLFLKSHYSQQAFDDSHSAEMLRRYLNRFDPGHFYFLKSDIAEFRGFSTKLDNLVRRGNIDLAFTIYERFLGRFTQRFKTMEAALEKGFDLSRDETFLLDRSKAPYPANPAGAARLFRKRLKREFLQMTLGGQSSSEATESLRRRYRSRKFRFEQFTRTEVVTAFLNAFTSSYDPHSSYMSADDYENFNIQMRLSLEGIGATLRWEDGYTIITSIIPGGAAYRQGTLQPEDKIVGVGEGHDGAFKDVTNQRLIDVVKLIRGHRGSTVRLAFMRKEKGVIEKRFEIAIIRDKILLKDGEAKGKIEERTRPGTNQPYRIGVITLPSFYVDFEDRRNNPNNYKSSSRDLERLLSEYAKKRVDAVVLDLRNNGGGGLDEAVSISGLVLNSGPVLMIKNTRGRIHLIQNPHQRPVYKGPLVLMINRNSASASEIVAGALQDYGRAILVGDRATFGKGTVQQIKNLERGLGALKTTVAKFYRPGSSSTQNRGVEADIVLPSLNNHLDIGESSLDNALPWDTVTRVAFRPWGGNGALLPVLREKSRKRIASDEFFLGVKADVDEYLRLRKNRKAITLKQMIAENRESEKKSAAPPDKAGDSGKNKEQVDNPLEETLRITMDYIQLLNAQTARSIATGAK